MLSSQEIQAAISTHEVSPGRSLLDTDFPEQDAFVEDLSPLQAAHTTRRSGKSFGGAKKLCRAAQKHPGCDVIVIGLTIGSVRKGWWPILTAVNRKYGLGAQPNYSESCIRFPNGSRLWLIGLDAHDRLEDRLLGMKLAAAVIDEAGSFTVDLRGIIYATLKPALADLGGWIALLGVPTDLHVGLFFDLTKQQDPSAPGRWTSTGAAELNGWSCHRWNASCNPHMREAWRKAIADLKEKNPAVESAPWFIRNFLGRWFLDTSKLCYAYLSGRNDYDGVLPTPPRVERGRWHFLLGLDLGFFPDPSAFVVAAYHDLLRELFFVETFRKHRMDISDVAGKTKELKARFDFDEMVVDNANAQAVSELNNRHDLSFEPADKTGKADFIALMNDDFSQGHIKLSPNCNGGERLDENDTLALAEEYAQLIWDPREAAKGRRVEHPACRNDISDAGLYVWRKAYSYLSQLTQSPPTMDASYFAKMAQAEQQQRLEELIRQGSEARIERDWQEGWDPEFPTT